MAHRCPVTFREIPYMDEMVLERTGHLFVGDLAAGKLNGKLAICPEQFPGVFESRAKAASVRESLMRTLPRETRAIHSGHGWPYYGNWREA